MALRSSSAADIARLELRGRSETFRNQTIGLDAVS
jgi:hypothetical protein